MPRRPNRRVGGCDDLPPPLLAARLRQLEFGRHVPAHVLRWGRATPMAHHFLAALSSMRRRATGVARPQHKTKHRRCAGRRCGRGRGRRCGASSPTRRRGCAPPASRARCARSAAPLKILEPPNILQRGVGDLLHHVGADQLGQCRRAARARRRILAVVAPRRLVGDQPGTVQAPPPCRPASIRCPGARAAAGRRSRASRRGATARSSSRCAAPTQ